MTRTNLSPGQLAQIACILEVSARKPGNVHPGRAFADTHFLDFLLSAAAIAAPLDRARSEGVGVAVLAAVEATRQVVASNTNLGMILLLAPLAAVREGVALREGISAVVDATTIADARLVYQAIRLSRPGGLRDAPEQDVANEPTITLREAMSLAADRDLVARQYANGFDEVFSLALPSLRSALDEGQPLETAIVSAFLTLLAHRPDTLILRKLGIEAAREASRLAAEVLAAGWAGSLQSRALCQALDSWLRVGGHARNPGTTADLVSAALFAALRDGTIGLPWRGGVVEWSGMDLKRG